MIELITFVLFASVAGYVWSALLTEPGEILDSLPALVYNITKSTFLMEAFFQCSKCAAGQIALWGYIIIRWSDYSLKDHLWVVVFSIFFAHVISTCFYKPKAN